MTGLGTPTWTTAAVFVFLLLLAGCFSASPGAGPPIEREPVEEPTIPHFAYPCDEGMEATRGEDVCVGSVVASAGSLYGPRGAIDPGDPDTVVLGATRSPGTTVGGTLLTEGVLLVTTDSGATWAFRSVPVDLPAAHTNDGPSHVMTVRDVIVNGSRIVVVYELGQAMFIGGVLTFMMESPFDLYVAVSDDLGVTWGPVAALSGGAAPFANLYEVGVHELGDDILVVWHERLDRPDARAHVTSGVVEGDVWTTRGDVVLPGLIDSWFVHEDGLRVHPRGEYFLVDVAPATGDVSDPIATPSIGRIVASDEGRVFQYSWFSGNEQLAWVSSDDAGNTWDPERRRAPLAPAPVAPADTSGHFIFRAAAIDTDGLLHLVVDMPFHAPPTTNAPYVHEGRQWHVEHLVLAASQDGYAARTRLTPEDVALSHRDPPVVGPDLEGSNSGISAAAALPSDDGVLLAWGFEKAIDFTVARPASDARGP